MTGIQFRRAIPLAALLLSACQPLSCSDGPPRRERLTTDSEIAVQNLNAQIEAQERANDRSPKALQFTITLVGLLETRAQYFGRLSDYDRALELAQEAVSRAPRDSGSFLVRASVRSSLHQFSLALSDLDQATALGADSDRTEPVRASILQAQGHLPEALELWQKLARSSSEITVLGSLAVAEGAIGNRREAERLFSEVMRHHRDVSPFPLAWIEFQQGLMWEDAGKLERARAHYESARAYLPGYALATGHLASVLSLSGDTQKAVELLRPLAESCEDPEYTAQLATVLVQLGDFKRASRYQASARDRFDVLAARHPEAFADHAARFWLGEDPKKALALAERNLANRKNVDAFDLAISAALAAKDSSVACGLADEAVRLPRATPRIHLLAGRAFESCGHKERAAEEQRAASAPAAAR